MNTLQSLREQVLHLHTEAAGFWPLAQQVYAWQSEHNPVFGQFITELGRPVGQVVEPADFVYLPIGLFKQRKVKTGQWQPAVRFESSTTSGQSPSVHLLDDPTFYAANAEATFQRHFPNVRHIVALLPNYLERGQSSLVHMVQQLMDHRPEGSHGYYLYDQEALLAHLESLRGEWAETLLVGVSFALLDLAASGPHGLAGLTVMETGGMKGRRKELTRQELHHRLCEGLGVDHVASEYGMTELLSQAYAPQAGLFRPAATMATRLRDPYDPLQGKKEGRGALDVIDLANLHSCAFIATDDLAAAAVGPQFEVLGRLDYAEIRGCNLLFS